MPGQGQGGVPTILVVDGDAEWRRRQANLLAAAGYAIEEADSAAKARSFIDSHPSTSLVVCDIEVPGQSGLDLISYLNADFPGVGIVITTSVDDPMTAALAFDSGCDGYLIKPFVANELLITVANALKRRNSEASRREQIRSMEGTISRLRAIGVLLRDIECSNGDEGLESEAISRLAKTASLPDEETGGHIERMSRYAARLGKALGYESQACERIRLTTALHDIGKIGVPDSVRVKPGSLSASEYSVMQRHAQIGYQLLAESSSELIGQAATVARDHHEWWDGGGYPRGIAGRQIPELARIAAVVDAFDALTTDRVYRPAVSVDEAMAVMSRNRARQFDPMIFDLWVQIAGDTQDIRSAFPDDGTDVDIRVLVVDDHDMFVESLVRVLSSQPGLTVVGAARTGAEAVRAASAYDPDVVLMDFEIPDGDGISSTERIRNLVPSAKIVMLTGRTDLELFTRAIAAGCAGFVSKTEGIDKLYAAIFAAHHDDASAPVPHLSRLLRGLTPSRRGLGSDLSAREREILTLVAEGLPNKVIAERLYLSPNTVRNHVQNVLAKLDAHSRLEAVATAVREGVIVR